MKWKGVDITTKGLLALTQPEPQTPEMEIEVFPIEGSDKSEVVEKGYRPYTLPVKFTIFDPDTYLDSAMEFLRGSGALISDDDTTKYWNARIVKQSKFQRMMQSSKIRESTVEFLVTDVFRYKVGETTTTLVAPGNVTNQGTVNSLPLIKITGTGTVVITIGGRSFTYVFGAEPHVFIDSFIQEAYYLTTLKNANMTGAFPYLTPGVNAISWTGTVTQIIITPRSRYL